MSEVTGPSSGRCALSLKNSSSSFSATGGTGTVTVTTARECAWAASAPSWIEVTSGKDGQGDGTIAYRVRENVDPVARRAAITVNDQRADIAQDSAPCRFDVSEPPAALTAEGGAATIEVRTHAACGWSAAADAAWVRVSPTSGAGNGTVTVTALPNGGPERVVTLTIAQDRLVLRQSAPAPIPVPTPGPVPPAPAPPPSPGPSPSPTPAPPNPGPTPGPPPSPPAPNPETVTLEGDIGDVSGRCPSVAFELRNRIVVTTNDTNFKKGDDCQDIKKDRRAIVEGEVQTGGRVLAQTVEIKKK